MENLFDCLCSLMLEVTNRERFLKGEGLQLMNLMLRYLAIFICAFFILQISERRRNRGLVH